MARDMTNYDDADLDGDGQISEYEGREYAASREMPERPQQAPGMAPGYGIAPPKPPGAPTAPTAATAAPAAEPGIGSAIAHGFGIGKPVGAGRGAAGGAARGMMGGGGLAGAAGGAAMGGLTGAMPWVAPIASVLADYTQRKEQEKKAKGAAHLQYAQMIRGRR
jgi:hypothetical protein